MSTIEISGASVCYRTVKSSKVGVIEVEYTGVLSDAVVPRLWKDLVARTEEAPALLLRVHKALTVYRTFPDAPAWVGRVCPGAIITRDDQYQTFCDFARALAKRGVVRGVFLQSHEHLALEWAEEEALEQLARWARSPRRKPKGVAVHS